MAYTPTPYYPGYQPMYYQPPMPDQLAQLRQSQFQPMQQPQQVQPSIVWVQNEMEAANYLVAPNSAVTLWDSNSPVVYLKQADASGKPSIKIYDLVERSNATRTAPAATQEPSIRYATKDDLDALAARVDALSSKETAPVKKKSVKEDAE